MFLLTIRRQSASPWRREPCSFSESPLGNPEAFRLWKAKTREEVPFRQRPLLPFILARASAEGKRAALWSAGSEDRTGRFQKKQPEPVSGGLGSPPPPWVSSGGFLPAPSAVGGEPFTHAYTHTCTHACTHPSTGVSSTPGQPRSGCRTPVPTAPSLGQLQGGEAARE